MRSLLLILVMAVPVASAAQEASSAEVSAGEQTTAPAPLTGQSAPRGPLNTESATQNFVSGGIAITQIYTDNAELTSNGRVSELSYNITPTFSLNHFTSRLSYNLGASAGFTINRTLSERNQATQIATSDLSYGLTRFVTLRFSDAFTNTTGLWSGVGVPSSTGIGAIQTANSSLFTYGQYRVNTALAELSAQLGASSFVGIRATHTYIWFPSSARDPVLGTLYGGNAYSTEAFYNHRLTPRHWFGITARAQRFDVNDVTGHTDTGSLIFFYGANIRPTIALSFFGGPEFSVTAAPHAVATPISSEARRMWSPLAGAVFSAQSRAVSGTVSFTHQVNNGGGLVSAVTFDSADAELLRQFGRHVQLGPGFTYTRSVPLVTSPTIQTYTGRFVLMYQLHNCSFTALYARDDRTAIGSNSVSANRVAVGFSYGFTKPIGR